MYDAVNHLISVNGQTNTTYGYCDLGDRHQQNPSTGSGTGVNYTLDLAGGLTQVLADGANTYLYGNGRIAQAGSTTEYFLGDALGSVRQLADTAGAVTLTQSYAPYGETVSSVGSGYSAFQFTGESRDSYIKLIYLRSRYYAPETGRFLTKDSWQGDYNRPLSLNRWNYVEGNPVNFIDPSGHNPCVGNPNYEMCYARWVVENKEGLTADIIKTIYQSYPASTLQLLQKEFDIKLPIGYEFRATSGGSLFGPYGNNKYSTTDGVNWWLNEYRDPFECCHQIIELADLQCFGYSTKIPEQSAHIDYGIYIPIDAFSRYKFSPDDLASIMIHEAVHAWQEDKAREFVGQQNTPEEDPSSLRWFNRYKQGIERQATKYMLGENSRGRTQVSRRLWIKAQGYLIGNVGGPDFPYTLLNLP